MHESAFTCYSHTTCFFIWSAFIHSELYPYSRLKVYCMFQDHSRRCSTMVPVATEKGNRKDELTMWPTPNVEISIILFVYMYIGVQNGILSCMGWQGKAFPFLPNVASQATLLRALLAFQESIRAKWGVEVLEREIPQIWDHVLNVVSFFRCSDIYFDEVTNSVKTCFFVWYGFGCFTVEKMCQSAWKTVTNNKPFSCRWTSTMICISRLVFGWFILRAGCEICLRGHLTVSHLQTFVATIVRRCSELLLYMLL